MKQFARIQVLICFVSAVVAGFADNARAATFNDDATTRGLWHMDTIDNLDPEGGYQDFVDDDNSFGAPDRPGWRELLLGVPGAATHPTFLPTGGPDGSGALEFDGVDDVGNAFSVWTEPLSGNVSIDFSMRPDSLPDPAGDNFMGVVGVLPFQIYLQDDGSGGNTGMMLAIAFYEGGGQLFGGSQGGLTLGEWHDVHADVTGTGGANGFGELTLTVDGVTHIADMAAELGNSYLWESQAVMGRMVTAFDRYFDGALDEVRIATAPYVYPVLDAADFDEDGDVDGIDFLAWQRGTPLPGFAEKSEGDANGDGYVDGDDLEIWQDEFGYMAPAVAALTTVPEPASAMLMLLGGVLGCGMPRFRNRARRAG